METLQAIRSRRSVRKFTGGEIPEEIFTKLLEAGMYAPSARNTQPWDFIIINKRGTIDRLPHIHPYAEMCYNAGGAILVCGNFETEKLEGYIALNCAAATQNILLAAHDLGLGAVWLGVYPRKERMEPLSQLFDLPQHIIPVSLIALGYPGEKIPTPERFKAEKIHYNVW